MRAAACLRVSTDEQASHGVSLEAQRAMIAAYAGLYGLELVAVVEDAGVSAKTLDRPGLQQVLAMLRRGDVQAVVEAKLDRLTRSVRDLGQLLDDHFGPKGGAALLSVSEQIDGRSAGGRMVLNLLATVSQWEREVIGERTRAALQHLKRQGRRTGSVPYGWRLVGGAGKQLEPDPAEHGGGRAGAGTQGGRQHAAVHLRPPPRRRPRLAHRPAVRAVAGAADVRMTDQSDFVRLEARVARLERVRLLDLVPILVVGVCIALMLAVIITKPRPHDRIEAALARIEQKLGTAP